jgi:Uma2 family endonuclease
LTCPSSVFLEPVIQNSRTSWSSRTVGRNGSKLALLSPLNNSLVHSSHLPAPPFSDVAARRPDIVILDETVLASEPLWEQEPVITLGRSIKLVVEVVSTNGKRITPEKLKSMRF